MSTKPASQRKSKQIVIRLTDADRASLDLLAEKTNLTPTEFIRNALVQQQALLETLVVQDYTQWLDTQIQNMSVKDFKAYKKKLNTQK